jgi:hypothetical protein
MGHGLPGDELMSGSQASRSAEHNEESPVPLPQLIRLRWAIRLTLSLGVAASVAANVLHAQPNIISQTISAWPPLALLITVELTSRIPMHRPLLAAVRVVSTATIAGIAAWVSYWHMRDVAARFGESGASAYLLPISVDGLIVVASVSLVELAGRIRMLTHPEPAVAPAPAAPPAPLPAPPVYQAPPPPAVASPTVDTIDTDDLDDDLDREIQRELEAPLRSGGAPHGTVRTPRSAPVSPAVGPVSAGARAAVSRTMVTESTAPRPRRPASETAQLADAIEAMQPEIREEELASRLNISVGRLRQVRREEAARRATLTQ